MGNSIIVLGWERVALAAGLVAINAAVSVAYQLGMERTLGLATVRTVVQLTAVGYLLEWVFSLDAWYAVCPVLLLMTVLAGRAAVDRTQTNYPGQYRDAFVAIFGASTLVLMFAVGVLVRPDPVWSARYVIPLLGMILGNSLTGVSLGLDRFVSGLRQERDAIELMLAHGADSARACQRLRADAVRVGMVPIINSMMVVGTVSLPGMMTGQILSGTPPHIAVTYQIVIMFCLAASTAMGTVGAVMLAGRRFFDDRHRLRLPERQ